MNNSFDNVQCDEMVNDIEIIDVKTGKVEFSRCYAVPQDLDRQELDDWIDSLISEEIE